MAPPKVKSDSPLGPKVVGEKAFAEYAGQNTPSARSVLGPKVLGKKHPAHAAAAAAALEKGSGSLLEKRADEAIAVILGLNSKDLLAGLEKLEAAGKNRKTVLAAIAERVTELTNAELDANQNGYVSVDELRAKLAEAPEYLDEAIAGEFVRSGGARKEALRLFIETEIQRDGGARADVLETLQTALG